jgi:hypothetical protein
MHRLLVVLPRWIFVLLALGAALAHTPAPVFAQIPAEFVASDTVYEVQLADGSTIIGRIAAVAGDRITFETQAGVRVQVDRAQIRSLRPTRGTMVGGQFMREDPNKTRLFFAPTGRTLAAGEGYFGVFELVFAFLSFGATDWLTLSGGLPLIFSTADLPPFYIAPKLRVLSTPGVQVSAGVFALFATGSGGGFGGIGYGVGTFGSNDRAFTVGAGLPFGEDDIGSQPLIMLGGESRIGRSTKLLSENYFVPGEAGAIVSGGVRFFGERLSADVGLAAPLGFQGQDFFFVFPVVNFTYNFGGRRR